ncbi:L,D-transpeptidase [Methylobacterium nodulans]|uniref:ErfK/YbiS/YcfS/YnhG family protein n=1 Tax=Methylobacterium nodulans (strain LMG 21967 / CNCM I-2342 / ORS 2060) TaxID=460265 RepID=B8IK49_METNO|nr:L,D-transpeptidase [Methylobacterium nodulans]ACL60062.1 ErfK/YbiS/YcfS/YnhG family protein [Methylobacterium nodulans ORS 2060]
MIKQSGGAAALAVAAMVACGPASAREIVAFDPGVSPGSIVVRTGERRLYFVNGDGTAIRYPIAVGKLGKQWTGLAHIEGKYVQPAWAPPAEVKRDNPRLPRIIAGGSPHNPMGAAALTLDRGEYAIHGTNRPSSIGTFASYGCIRMYNQDVVDLYSRVEVGTPVIVTH